MIWGILMLASMALIALPFKHYLMVPECRNTCSSLGLTFDRAYRKRGHKDPWILPNQCICESSLGEIPDQCEVEHKEKLKCDAGFWFDWSWLLVGLIQFGIALVFFFLGLKIEDGPS